MAPDLAPAAGRPGLLRDLRLQGGRDDDTHHRSGPGPGPAGRPARPSPARCAGPRSSPGPRPAAAFPAVRPGARIPRRRPLSADQERRSGMADINALYDSLLAADEARDAATLAAVAWQMYGQLATTAADLG